MHCHGRGLQNLGRPPSQKSYLLGALLPPWCTLEQLDTKVDGLLPHRKTFPESPHNESKTATAKFHPTSLATDSDEGFLAESDVNGGRKQVLASVTGLDRPSPSG